MTAAVRALRAETLKMKRTLALWLVVIVPLAMVGLEFVSMVQRGEYYLRQFEDPWIRFGQQMLLFWALLALPLFITLETALLGGLEHRNDQWKHLSALPLPRWTVYVAKQVAGMALIGLSIGVLVIFTVLAGLGLQAFKPGIGFTDEIPWGRLIRFAVGVYLASWLIISMHTWISLRWRNFVVATGVGIAATIGALVIAGSDLAAFYPWTLPGMMSDTFITGEVQWTGLIVGSLGGIVVALWGCRNVTRRDVL